MKQVYIDLATRMGITIFDTETKEIEHKYIELDKKRKMETYLSKTCRKTLPNGYEYLDGIGYVQDGKHTLPFAERTDVLERDTESGKYCLYKHRQNITTLTLQEQLTKLEEEIRFMLNTNELFGHGHLNFTLEAIAFPMGKVSGNRINAFHKQSKLYAIFDMLLPEYETITANEGFSGITEHVSKKLGVGDTKKQSTKINRKKTSKAIASGILDKEIKDDNEADSILMMFYDNQELFEIYKKERENE